MLKNKTLKLGFLVLLIVANLSFCFRLTDTARAQAFDGSVTELAEEQNEQIQKGADTDGSSSSSNQGSEQPAFNNDDSASTSNSTNIPSPDTRGNTKVTDPLFGDVPPVVVSQPKNNATEDYTTPGVRTFTISAYYSPIKGQNKYVTGSYAGDIRLNGGGVHGADGTPVYPGMVAAPKVYAFGTKMKIPGIGTVAVHDRGGAIVTSGQRGNSHDRLDVWMGYGDQGLKRALNWGKRTVDVMVYGIDSGIAENITLAGYSESEKFVVADDINPGTPQNGGNGSATYGAATNGAQMGAAQNGTQTQAQTKSNILTLSQTLAFGNTGDDVAKLQKVLKGLQYYQGQINAVFDQNTLLAVTKFQIDKDIINDEQDYGAGHVGPKTMKILADVSSGIDAGSAATNVAAGKTFTRDLKLGDSGDEVRKLQEELVKFNLLGIDSTGFYGDVTAHAVFKFQQTQMLAGDLSSKGAGEFGPKTREVLNGLIAQREETQKMIANKKPEDQI